MAVRVRDMMTTDVVCVQAGASMRTIALVLGRYGISAVPVVDGERHVLGLVSEADLMHKLADGDGTSATADRTKRSAVTAQRLMTAPAVTVRARAEIAEAARLMQEHRIKRLPVVSDPGELEGIVSRGDLVKVYARPDPWVLERVERLLMLEFELPHVRAEVRDGIVTLTGRVRLRSSAVAVRRAVRTIEGVLHVDDRIRFDADDLSPFALHTD
ncbi:CBS domain-containing protein [Nocardiopsis sp. RSe5-2]|uniref:CBS domain-containing protein n=1 Tax=Nocardiopsis endophytica TaxID=3018445 RepID=A0ABT4U4B1_9ACTN|nr:CBS domain-containing protein [Nocardiopsis endophytica]MDA2811799.1 CBS domain-containing protein [Nocardiopsis endophytica]